MGFTFVNSGQTGNTGSGTSLAVNVTGVNAGDLVVVLVKWESTDTTVSVSDGTSSLVASAAGNVGSSGAYYTSVFYLLSSVASGTVTYTVTWGAARTFRDLIVVVHTPSAAASLDGTATGTYSASGTTLNSGNITTTGTDGMAFGTYGDFSGNHPTSAAINGVGATREIDGGAGVASAIWMRAYTAGFTGAATGTITSAGPDWVCEIIAFKIGAGGGGGGFFSRYYYDNNRIVNV